jgi:hypothetical protein
MVVLDATSQAIMQKKTSGLAQPFYRPYSHNPQIMLIKGVIGLTVLTSTALASNFFVHEDVLAHPMYSISLGQTPISNSTAQQLLKTESTDQTEIPNPSQQLQRIFKTEDTHVSFKLNLEG